MAAQQMDLQRLRELIDEVLADSYQSPRHKDLPALCDRLRLPSPPPEEGHSKHERLTASLQACPDGHLAGVAEAILDHQPLPAWQRNQIQDLLWLGRPHVDIPGRTRRELARDFDLSDHLEHAHRLIDLLEWIWDLGGDLPEWGAPTTSLRDDIERHVVRFRDDWTVERLFEELGAFSAPHPRFGRFLEGLASAETIPDEQAQRRFVEMANHHLEPLGAQLRQEGESDGYPLFHLVQPGHGPARRPRNVIFATLGKPDIRFTDALDNDIEIAERADQVLVYDRDITKDGLLGRDLLTWWQETRHVLDPQEATRSLYARMKASLPPESEGQKNLLWLYYNIHQDNLPDVPALLPEVWVHWDHKTVRQRGVHALQNLRMDFLMLLPGNRRMVLEVDGMQHYTRRTADGSIQPDSTTYAATMAGDRDLKFRGYEVFRFGHDELRDLDTARPLITDFFDKLLGRPPGAPPQPA
ncbi:hypothetical protein [Streptomyces sp. NPDC002619]|uniref:AbiJ-related protein n=1 Tax=Streptomyces sp. NPDC002619 TaxID=3364655 RepID=UPI0036B05BF1